MPYLPGVNSYMYQSSLVLQAYPTTTLITIKYSLKRKRTANPAAEGLAAVTIAPSDATESKKSQHERQSPPANITFKTFERTSGICLKYQTNKSAEVGRLVNGLGRLAKGEVVHEANAFAIGNETSDSKAEQSTSNDASAPKVERVSEAASGGRKAKRKKDKK